MQYSSSGVGCSSSVLWVPDHAVTRCTNCQTEFWLVRRKHHCRSCGQIFCAECSVFTAHLPDERVYQPVRLCEPCYRRISSMTVPSNTTGSDNTPESTAVPISSGSSSSSSNQVANGAGSSIIAAAPIHAPAAAPTHAPAAAVPAPLNDDPNAAFLQARSNVTMMMRDRITSMSQIQSLLAAECSSEASRASDSCCKQNVTAAATN
uniref:Lateral signaling target protein 2 homolog n=1 Tax=Anopheles farauti TaxID=69004 RepID=A0A182R006_9DIPT